MKNYNLLLRLMLVAVIIMIANACWWEDDDGETIDPSDAVQKLDSGDTAALSFSAGDEVYQIVSYSVSTTESETGFSIDVAGGSAGDESSERLKQRKLFKDQKPSWMSEARYNQILNKNKWSVIQHQRAMKVAEEGVFENGAFKFAKLRGKLSSECGDDEVSRNGECSNEFDLQFMDFEGDVTNITVEVKAKGEHAAIVVDADDSSDVSQDDIDEILNMFDNVVYPRNQFFYGGSVFDGVDYVDRDGDGIHLIVMSHIVNEIGAVGLFNPDDFGTDLNVADILYIVIPDDDNPVVSILGTIAHEYSHMLMYGIKRAKFKALETIWLDESMAHLMEDLSGFGIDNLDVTEAYLSAPDQIGWAFSFDDSESETRGMGYLIMRYLFEQKGGASYSETDGSSLSDGGGADFVTTLIQTDNTGFDALDDALGGSGSWGTYLADWIGAVAIDGTDIDAGSKYAYQDVVTDKITGQERGVCTHCTRSSAYGHSLQFDGMAATSLDSGTNNGIVKSSGVTSMKISSSENQNITFTADDEDTHFGVYRVK